MKHCSIKDTILIGLTLFSMFFGAGNLIFAPFLGAQAGSAGVLALFGFVLTAAAAPVGAVLIINRFGTAQKMISTWSPLLATVFLALVYLLIGPAIAIPRTAVTSFSMLGWLFPDTLWMRGIYSVVFFGLASLVALRPGHLKDVLGKYLTPILLVLVLLVSVLFLFTPANPAASAAAYGGNPFGSGLMDGYQTMDILAAFCFGPVLLLNIKDMGIQEPKAQKAQMTKAAWIAGGMLAGLYFLLGICGMHGAGEFQKFSNGTGILLGMSWAAFGTFGSVVTSLIFLIACFNVCSGLLSCCAGYFQTLTQKGTYAQWLMGFTVVSMLISLFGLDAILSVTAPVLGWICPIALVLLAIGLITLFIQRKKQA